MMRILRDFQSTPKDATGAVIAIGNFDGVHLGHRAVLAKTAEIAHSLGAPAAAMSFHPHPRQFFKREDAPRRLMRLPQQLAAMRAEGMDWLFLARFNAAFASLTATTFTEQLLHQTLHARHVVTGVDFIYGQNRQGNATLLEADLARLNIGFTAIEPVTAQTTRISSTAIRKSLALGDITQASAMLGRPYAVESRVHHGDKRGRQIGTPTLNLSLYGLALPAYGVYTIRARFGAKARWFAGVANVGIRPTFGGDAQPRLEAHLFTPQPDRYGERLTVELLTHLRPEQRFETPDALVAQIQHDIAQAKTYFTQHPELTDA